MSLAIQDRLLFQLHIEDKEVELDQNVLDYIHVVESVRLHVPMMSMRIKDTDQYFTKNNVLVDGARIRVTIGIEDQKLVLPFRLFSNKESTQNGNSLQHLNCYLDVPRFWTESTTETFRSTASGALSQIADRCGMRYDGPNTNDQQIWVPANKKWHWFAKDITRHAYIDQNSCMQHAVLLDRTIRLRNVSDMETFRTAQSFGNVESNTHDLVSDYRTVNKSGFFNTLTGYKDTRVVQSLYEKSTPVQNLNVRRNSARLMMHDRIRSGIGQNRVTFSPIAVGNTHANYENALYQNLRLGNLFGFGIEMVTPRLVTANLLDVVSCVLSKPGVNGASQISGKYLVTSKVLYIENFNFYQKLELARHGINAPASSQV
jgi:hypothetical protein